MEESIVESTRPCEEKQGKLKKKRTTKKSVVLENEKRQKIFDTLLECRALPEFIIDVLKKEEEEKGYILKLSEEDTSLFWEELAEVVRQQVHEVVNDGGNEVLSAIVSLSLYAAMFHSVVDCEHFTQIAIMVNLLMTHSSVTDQQLKNKICELSEFCCIKELSVPGKFYLDTLNHLLEMTLSATDLKSEIKRVWEMHVPLTRVNLQAVSCEALVSLLTRAVACPSYLACKEGRQFIAFTFTLDTRLIKKFHQAVKDFLLIAKRSQAAAYGEVYYNAWVNGSTEVRQAMETQCFQNLMTHMFTFPRPRQELSHLGQNVFAILSYLHNHRLTAHFSKILTELYMPLLWRHLRSGNNIMRCNAAEVFLDIYPLEKPGSGKAEENEFLGKQHNEMVDLLTDNCHVLRIIAIKGICNKLFSAWATFPQEVVQVLMRHLVALASDGSTYLVRRTLYTSLSVLLHNPESAAYLARLLPSLRDFVHDENEKVRRSFVKLLIEVKNLPQPAPTRYWKIVPLNHLAARLELEGAEVGRVLVRLLLSNIYTPGMSVEKFLDRLLQFIETSPKAARKLFQYSSKELDCKNAVRIMLTILLNLRMFVKTRAAELNQQVTQEQKEVEPVPPRRKRRKSKQSLEPIQEDDNVQGCEEEKENQAGASNLADSTTTSCSEQNPYSKPGVAHTLIDIVSLLWGIHGLTLASEGNEKDHNDLMNLACAGIPLFLKYYKGTPTYYAVVHLASMVPPGKLTPISTVCSACVSQLRLLSELTPDNELQVLVHALCCWNRFADIQDVVVDWLDQGFRTESLNQSQILPKCGGKSRKVRFVAKGGKPMLALRLLDAVFIHPINSKRVLAKAYNQVHELYMYLDKVKIIAERRLILDVPLESPMLCDEFIQKCLYRYTKLIILLHRPEPQAGPNQTVIDPFNASEVFNQFLQWTMSTVKPMISQQLEDEPNLSVLLMKDILRTGANLVDLNLANLETVKSLAQLVRGLLTSEYGMWFVEPGMLVMQHLKEFSEAHYGAEDEAQLMRTVLPCLLSTALICLAESRFSKENLQVCIQNLAAVKTAMYDLAYCLLQMYGPQSQHLTAILKLFSDAMVKTIVHEIKQLQLLDPVDKVQELPYVCGVLLSVVTRPALVSLWLATVPSSVQSYSQDANVLGAAVSLLHTLSHCDLRLPKPLLQDVLRTTHSCVNNYSRESTLSTPDDLSNSVFSSSSIEIKKMAPPVLTELADFLDCSLH